MLPRRAIDRDSLRQKRLTSFQVGVFLLVTIVCCLVAYLISFGYFGYGFDYPFYISNFSNRHYITDVRDIFSGRLEPGFLLSTWLLSSFFESPTYVYLFFVLFCLITKAWVCVRSNVSVVIFFSFYFSILVMTLELNQLRLAMAFSIVMVALISRFDVACFLLFFACLFHYSIIVFPMFFVIQNIIMERKFIHLILISSTLIFLSIYVLDTEWVYLRYLTEIYHSGEFRSFSLITAQSLYLFATSLICASYLWYRSFEIPLKGFEFIFIVPLIGCLIFVVQFYFFPLLAWRVFETLCLTLPFCLSFILTKSRSRVFQVFTLIALAVSIPYLFIMIDHRLI